MVGQNLDGVHHGRMYGKCPAERLTRMFDPVNQSVLPRRSAMLAVKNATA